MSAQTTDLHRSSMAYWLRHQIIWVALVGICVLGTVRQDSFLTPENIFNVLRQNSMLGLLSLGMLIAMLSGGIDLSLGAMLAMGGVVAAAASPLGSIPAALCAVASTTLVGLLTGATISYGRVQPFIATLVVNMAIRGMLLAIVGDETLRVAKSAEGLKWLGRGWIGPVPVPVVALFAVTFVVGYVLQRTRFGRHVYALGDNDEAARLMGLNVNRVRLAVYAMSGALGGLAGVILAARLGVGQPVAGIGWELSAIAAVVLGMTGRGGTAVATLVGVLILGLIFNILNLEGTINTYWQAVIRGLILLVVVLVQSVVRLDRR
ncbi:MAG: ABC transporter permease [Gemmataceae bacterium]